MAGRALIVSITVPHRLSVVVGGGGYGWRVSGGGGGEGRRSAPATSSGKVKVKGSVYFGCLLVHMTSVHAVEAGSSRTQDDPYVEEDGTDRSALQNGHLAAASQNDSKKVPVAPTAHVETRRRIAHYAGLVLASMIGCIIRLGLEAMGDCECLT